MLKDTIGLPAAADVMPYDRVKYVAAVASCWGTFADDLLDLVNTVAATATIYSITLCRFLVFLCFAALALYGRPVKHMIDVGEFGDGIEPITSDRQRFIGAPEQLGRDWLAVDLQ